MAGKVTDHYNDVSDIYFVPEKINFSTLISAIDEQPIDPVVVAKSEGFAPGNAPFVSRAAFDRSYYRFAAFMSAPLHKPSFADPHMHRTEDNSKINVDYL